MTSSALFAKQEYIDLLNEYNTILSLKQAHGDKLAVNAQGRLEVSKGGFLQAPKRTIKNMKYGSYNRVAVTEHLRELDRKTTAFFYELTNDPSYLHNAPQEVRLFAKKMTQMTSALEGIQASYNPHRLPLGDKLTPDKIAAVANAFRRAAVTLQTAIEAAPPQLPSLSTPAEILVAIKDAEVYIIPRWQKITAIALASLATVILAVPLLVGTLFKWCVWNPVEYSRKGTITTKTR